MVFLLIGYLRLLHKLSPGSAPPAIGVDQMLDLGAVVAEMKGKSPFFNDPVGLRHPFVLPPVLHPGFHDKGLQEAGRVGRILEQTPPDGAVAPPDDTQGSHGLGKFVGIPGVNEVLNGYQNRPLIRFGFENQVGFGPMERRRQVRFIIQDNPITDGGQKPQRTRPPAE